MTENRLVVDSIPTQHAMPPEHGKKWETECLNTRFPLPTLLCAGYSVKLIYLIKMIYLVKRTRPFLQKKTVVSRTFSIDHPLEELEPN